MSAQPFDLTYRIDTADYRAMMRAYWHQTPFRKWRVRALIAFPLVVALAGLYLAWRTGSIPALAVAVTLLLFMPLAPLINNWSYDRMYRRLGLGDSEVRLVATDDGLETTLNNLSSRLTWAAVKRVEDLPRQILLWINPYQALILPKRAFADEAAAQSFLDYVRRHAISAAT